MSDDPIRKFREDAEAREAEREWVKRQRLRQERQVTEGYEAAALREAFEQRLNLLERAFPELQESLVTVMRTVSDIFDRLGNDGLTKAQSAELGSLKREISRIKKTLAEVNKQRDFWFARETTQLPKLDS